MVVKFFKSPEHGGSVGAIRYLLNARRVRNGTAKILSGDPNLTASIIESIKNSQKVDVGCLSFEEANIDEKLKFKLMREFEEMLMPGMSGKFNILWVQHTDKGRLELNFCIPKIELLKKRAITPYLHRADLPRVETWQDLQNLKYGFSNPKNPAKARTVELNSKVVKLTKDYESLDRRLHQAVLEGLINNRDELINLLKESGISVSRAGKKYLSLKLPNSTKARRFKGSIYDEQFKSVEFIAKELKNQTRRAEEFNQRDREKEIDELEKKLRNFIQRKAEQLQKRYKFIKSEEQEEQDISLLSINRPNSPYSKLLDTYKSNINDESPRDGKGKDILHQNQEKSKKYINHGDKNPFYIPFWQYEKKIKELFKDLFIVNRNEFGNVLYQDIKEPKTILLDKGQEVHFESQNPETEPNREQIKAMILICEQKGWQLEKLKFNTPSEKSKLIFQQEIRERIKQRDKEQTPIISISQKNKTVKKDKHIEPKRVRKEDYYNERGI